TTVNTASSHTPSPDMPASDADRAATGHETNTAGTAGDDSHIERQPTVASRRPDDAIEHCPTPNNAWQYDVFFQAANGRAFSRARAIAEASDIVDWFGLPEWQRVYFGRYND